MQEYAQQGPIAAQAWRSRPRFWLFGALALAQGGIGLALALHYPIAPMAAGAVFLLCCSLFFAWPMLWLVALPALLPVIGFAPWTGWITFEELDLLVLAAGCAGYARLAGMAPATRRTAVHEAMQGSPASALVWVAACLFAGSTLASMLRGFDDSGGFRFGWYQGYHEAMNSLRVAKAVLSALLLLPLWLAALRQDRQRCADLLSRGLTLGLLAASLTTVWERLAFTDLLNFSSDYRTTGMFWEMHVGGATLDGFLALALPFALHEWTQARGRRHWALASLALILGAYACLTTFSRGVYLAVPLSLTVFSVMQARRPKTASTAARAVEPRTGLAVQLAIAFGLGALWMFPSSGYRGMAGLLSAVALTLPLIPVLQRFKPYQWRQAALLSLIWIVMAVAAWWWAPKTAYASWGGGIVLTIAMLLRGTPGAAATALSGFVLTLAGAALIAVHWGGQAALQRAAPVLLAALALSLWSGTRRRSGWPNGLRWQATTVGMMTMVAAVVGVFGGGSYMAERFATGPQDLEGRRIHWQQGLDMLGGSGDWLLGRGLGRYPADYALASNPREHPGDYRLKQEGDNRYLTVAGGQHTNGWGEIFRVTQRIDEPGDAPVVTARARASQDVVLHFEVCEKHLLYGQGCLSREVALKGQPEVWQDVRLVLVGRGAHHGSWLAPRILAFSVAVESRGRAVDLDDLSLKTWDDRQLLSNGDFARDMARWFFSSDRYHLPWHIKNLFLGLIFDQGLVGLTLWLLLVGSALLHITIGQARNHPLAPPLCASLIGFLVVGLFDTLLDSPRLALPFYALVLVALTLPSPGWKAVGGLAHTGRR